MIDWKRLAEDVGASKDGLESGSSDMARSAIELLIGIENIKQGVDYYVKGGPGAELVRHMIWQLRPLSAMERCFEIYKYDLNLENRRKAVCNLPGF